MSSTLVLVLQICNSKAVKQLVSHLATELQQRWATEIQQHADFLDCEIFTMMVDRKLIKGWANTLLASLQRQRMCYCGNLPIPVSKLFHKNIGFILFQPTVIYGTQQRSNLPGNILNFPGPQLRMVCVQKDKLLEDIEEKTSELPVSVWKFDRYLSFSRYIARAKFRAETSSRRD